MANALTVITILHDAQVTAATIQEALGRPTSEARAWARDLAVFVEGLGVTRAANVRMFIETGSSSTRASATITITHANVTDGDTLTIGGKVITAKTSGSGENEWTIGADATADAVALVACINANSVLKGLITASNVAGVVTLTYWTPGRAGNLVTLATSDATAFALSAALLGGGTGTQQMAPRQYGLGV